MLMFEAYQGTVDDDGETLEDALAEVEGTFNGRYGRWIADASFILRSSEGSGIIAASLLTLYQGLPLLAFSMTHPRYPRRGHARSLITASIAALQDRGTAASRHCRSAALPSCPLRCIEPMKRRSVSTGASGSAKSMGETSEEE